MAGDRPAVGGEEMVVSVERDAIIPTKKPQSLPR
jgi:hypothetical protein